MVKIISIDVQGSFRYLWLKYVCGVDLSHHCAECLKGSYSAKISSRTKHAENLLLDEDHAPFYYLCGVSTPYIWANNFHLAFRERRGSHLSYSDNGIAVEIENAEPIEFSEADIDPNDPHLKHVTYRTCRNWQFAHKICKLWGDTLPGLM